MATSTQINLAQAIVIAAGYNKPAVIEQINNAIITARGKDPAGNARVAKFTDLSPTYDVPTYAASLEAQDITDPISMEQVSQVALTHS